jgi:hypothetical protein
MKVWDSFHTYQLILLQNRQSLPNYRCQFMAQSLPDYHCHFVASTDSDRWTFIANLWLQPVVMGCSAYKKNHNFFIRGQIKINFIPKLFDWMAVFPIWRSTVRPKGWIVWHLDPCSWPRHGPDGSKVSSGPGVPMSHESWRWNNFLDKMLFHWIALFVLVVYVFVPISYTLFRFV